MDTWALVICAVTGFLVSWSLIPLVQRASGHSTHHPSFHHTHGISIPRFGGVAIAAAFIAVVLAALSFEGLGLIRRPHQWGVIIGSLAMFGLGLWDDFKPLGAKTKLLGQTLIAIAAYCSGVQIELLKNPFTDGVIELGGWSVLASVVWLVAFTNLINLIDGIDGLAGGIALMLMCLLAYAGLNEQTFALFVAVGMTGTLVGFLCYNFPPAKIFMGDGGAYFLGFLIGSMTITTSQKGTVAAALIAPVFALALPIVDVIWAIVRRGLKGLPIFRPDRKHLHHKLVEIGFSRRSAVLILYGVSLCCLLLAFGVFWSQGQLVPILFGAMFLILFATARFFGFIKDWCAVGRELGASFQLRRETRYALQMCRWLEMEAERSETLQELWTSYLFITRKLGLSQVKLVLDTGRTVSRSPIRHESADFHRNRHELLLANIKAIEFASESSAMSPKLFEHLTELAVEAWMKSVQRWQRVHGIPAIFEPAVPSETAFFSRGRALISNVV
jgi:UDP-GlcNAc:undecaprenyl-phosphate GlcNAc-1-phosphate transferase